MRIREVGQKAENLIEQGEQVKRQQVYYQQATVNARNQLMSAYAMLDAASQTDEDGNPQGDIGYARAQIYAAQAQLASAERGLKDATQKLEFINRDKLDTIKQVEKYTEGEKKNLSKLQELQNKRFGGNANAFVADLVARMNSSETTKARLLQSLGKNAAVQTFTVSGVKGSTNVVSTDKEDNDFSSDDFLNDERKISFTQKQLSEYRLLRKELQNAHLMNTSQKVSKVQALEMLMAESDFQCSVGRARTPDEILKDMKKAIRENWMNNFNAEQWKKILPEKMYLDRLELYRKGLAYEIGNENAEKMTIEELEQYSKVRYKEYIDNRKEYETVERWNKEFLPIVKQNIRSSVDRLFSDYVSKEKLEKSMDALNFMTISELAQSWGEDFEIGTLGFNDTVESNVWGNAQYEPLGVNLALATAVHENLHMMSSNKGNGMSRCGIMVGERNRAINEAVTEYYTFLSLGGDLPLRGLYPGTYSAYSDLRDCIPIIEGVVGASTVKEAYFKNKPELIEKKIDECLGENGWNMLSRDFEIYQYSDLEKVEGRIARGYAKERIMKALDMLRNFI